jgi:polyphosphate glucokinase
MAAHEFPENVVTLSVDVGGSGVKGALLDKDGTMITDKFRVDTPYPCPPARLVETVVHVGRSLGTFDRVSVGFPGLVRGGVVYMVPSLSRIELEGQTSPELAAQWRGFDLETALNAALEAPVRVVNDADMQGSAVISGEGMEFVMTLGTGIGTALFFNGVLIPHLELGHAMFRKGETFEEQMGNAARKAVGKERWIRRVTKCLGVYDQFLYFDRIYVGGGNARLLDGVNLGPKATIVSNTAGILGGIAIWRR